MDILLIIAGSLFTVVGFIGSFVQVIPGPLLSYTGLIMLQLTSIHPFSGGFLIIWVLLVAVLMVLDNVIPAYGTKKLGGTAYGVWGSIIGLIVGTLFFLPLGIVIGPLAGAFAGELIGGETSDRALRSAMGSFAGFLVNTLLKVMASGVMGYYFFANI